MRPYREFRIKPLRNALRLWRFQRLWRTLVSRLSKGRRYYQFRLQIAAVRLADCFFPNHPPLPPPILRYRISTFLGRKAYLSVGKGCFDQIHASVAELGQDLDRLNYILDWGCGSGRTLRWFADHPPTCHVYGVDIDNEAITWCERKLPFADYRVIAPNPPLPFPNDQFDLIYGLSIFTHLDEEAQFAWLAELRRVSRPGGILLASTHGSYYSQNLGLQHQAELREKGFLYIVEASTWKQLDGQGEFYHAVTYHTPDYIHQHWSKSFAVRKHTDRGLCGVQDLVVLQKQ